MTEKIRTLNLNEKEKKEFKQLIDGLMLHKGVDITQDGRLIIKSKNKEFVAYAKKSLERFGVEFEIG